MDRLDFVLPEFTRIIWVSEEARDIWQPRIANVNSAWPQIELGTVTAGLRRGALQTIAPDRLMDLQVFCYDNDLEFIILGQEGAAKVYGNASVPVEQGKPWNYRVYVGDSPKVFMKAWLESDNLTIGAYLGYPSCCSEFFQENWVNRGWRDLTYPMTRNTDHVGTFHTNILLRHLGIRAVFHLPCSFDCDITPFVGQKILQYAVQAGFDMEVAWLTDILNWPVRWSSLHGVAMITTPVLKIITSSDALPEEVRYDLPGSGYPEGGATGTEFPFQSSRPISMLQGIKDTWTDNGFSSFSVMRKAHDLIIKSVSKILLDSGRVLDLGCGNGVLLERIVDQYRYLVPYGVENWTERYVRAVERIGENIKCGNIFNTSFYLKDDFQLVIISLNRFNEVEGEDAEMLLKHLRAHTRYLIVTTYFEPWIPELDTLLYRHFTLVDSEATESCESRIYKPK